jgi:hypothetical protein
MKYSEQSGLSTAQYRNSGYCFCNAFSDSVLAVRLSGFHPAASIFARTALYALPSNAGGMSGAFAAAPKAAPPNKASTGIAVNMVKAIRLRI